MSDNNEDHIGKALGLDPLENKITVLDKMLADGHDDSASKDFEMARANIYEVIHNGQTAIETLGEIASQSQHPRAFEVLAKLMDTMLNANKELMNLQSKIREINNIDSPINEKAKSVTNNLFVGSTAELQRMIKEMKKTDDV